MVTELARFTAQPGQADVLEQGLRAAMAVIRRGEGCRAIQLLRNIEDPNIFVYEIEWETLEHHTVGFRGGPLFAEYRAHIAGLFVDPVDARHYERVGG
jgi:heme-degrading monooxygenase HmoA